VRHAELRRPPASVETPDRVTAASAGDLLEPDWNPYTRWERLPKWARGLIWALFITVLVWVILSVAGDQG
jgi:hypothetical protein